MYCGSHIHFSPIDNKPLCSYSIKLCKQRRINGYAFCIRHILEDKSAPFKQCVHVAKYNQQKCSNAIPANEERHFCNSHMQIAGITPKKERKDKRTANNNNNGANKAIAAAIDAAIVNNKCNINAISNGKNNNELKCVSDKLENLNAFVKLAVKLNGNMKKLDKCNTSSAANITSGLTATSISSHLPDNCNNSNNNNKNTNTNANNNKRDIKRSKRKKKDKTNIEKFVFARKKRNSEHLYNYHIWSSSDDEDDTDFDDHNYSKEDLVLPSFATHLPRIDELEANELKNELTTQKWLLSNLIKMLQKDLDAERKNTCSALSSLKLVNGVSYIDHKLRDNAKRSHNSITKGICCYSSDESSCTRPSLPYSRHCSEHILYNVDQLLFSRCTAKCAETLTQCLQPTFDITHEEPLCLYHQSVPQELDVRPNSPQPDGKSIKRRKKTKPMALTRVSRRGKKRRKTGADCISLIEDNSVDKSIVEEVIAEGTVDKINLLPLPSPQSHSSVIDHIVVSSLPQSSTSSTLPLNSRPLRLPPLVSTTPSSPIVVMGTHVIPPPPPLEPIEEAFVASIVADLPQLSNDADFTEVLNKIPDDAFSEFLLDHQNGGPSTEETEALEQALAMVNKDMQNMVAAAVNGSTSQTIDLNGQSDILGFSNWLGNLTTEQRQQLNGLIDGAIASNSLSPILKTAYETFPTPVMKSSTASVNNNMFANVYPLTHTMSMQPNNQEFIPISPTVPLLTNSLLTNGLSSHPS